MKELISVFFISCIKFKACYLFMKKQLDSFSMMIPEYLFTNYGNFLISLSSTIMAWFDIYSLLSSKAYNIFTHTFLIYLSTCYM